MSLPAEIAQALRNGHPTAQQRRTWSQEQWGMYEAAREQADRTKQDAHRDGDSNARLLERLNELEARVAFLEAHRG